MNYPYYNSYFQPQRQELIKVNGIEGAKNYPLSPGSTVALFDAESDIMYIKSMDAGGFPSIRTFTFQRRYLHLPLTWRQGYPHWKQR